MEIDPIAGFTQSVIEKLGCYVYLLIDPDTGKPFYVGKGTENRVFHHARAALDSPISSDKLDKIREIISSGKQVKYVIARHGMNDITAFEVESALMDYIGFEELSNSVLGHHSTERGLMSAKEVVQLYNAPKITIDEPSMLIIINKEYRYLMAEMPKQLFKENEITEKMIKDKFNQKLYEKTRIAWVVGRKRERARFAFAVCDGLVREIYKIEKWIPNGKRWEFIGEVASDWNRYNECIYGDVSHYIGSKGSQNPIRYVGCFDLKGS